MHFYYVGAFSVCATYILGDIVYVGAFSVCATYILEFTLELLASVQRIFLEFTLALLASVQRIFWEI